MSNQLLSMGSQAKPPVLMANEYQQWNTRMIQFLNHKNRDFMKAIINGPDIPMITVKGQPATDSSPEILGREVPKPYEFFNEKQKEQYKIEEETLIYLTMAIPNDIYNRVDSQSTAKAIWDELAKEFEGSEAPIQAKQNLCINACEGFHAKEGELLLDTYSRYNIILNDLRRNNIAKSASVINYKFIKNLNPEWKNFAINLQMSKNIAQENVTNIFCTLTRHGNEVRSINNDSNNLKDSVALIAGKGYVSSARSKQKVSKALVTEVTDSNSASSEEELEIDSDPDIQKFSEDLALITCRFKKSFGKKRFYSKPKKEDIREGKREEKREERKDEPGRCYNYGKFGHFSRDSKFKKVKNSEYYARKSLIAMKAEEGKVLMAEEENWLFQSSDDKEQAHFTQVSYMAKLDGDDEDSETQSEDANSEVSDNSELIESLMAQIHGMKDEFALLKGKLTSAHQSVLSFCDENAILKVVVEEKEKEKDDLKAEKASLKEKISGLETDLVNLNAKKGEFQMKFEVCYKERNEACTKIKQLEDINMKRGQTEQTLNLLTNKLQDERFYKLKPGLGVPINEILKKAPEHLYNIDKFGSVFRPIPNIRENFVEASTSTSLTETKGREEMGENKSGDTDSQNLFKSVGFQYSDLNKSYETRKIEFTESESLFTTPSIE
ncbi:hypothetical protein L6452_34919 [Arctium lappa]|uniref:Uncharacterized protein n=1 Tax=Arctium lappa TaxID=4217 RepID=A0ACB8YIR7_ARCLA|nr:hypothetical protein L6452_34919 [Arctium lappa]